MSSHHIVKEDQEPGLLILDWNDRSMLLIQQLSQWSPKIIVDESVVDKVVMEGVKIDVLLTNSPESHALMLKEQFPVTIFNKDVSEQKTILNIKNELISRLHVLSNQPIDHWKDKMPDGIVVYGKYLYFHLISNDFQKWQAGGKQFSVIEEDREVDCIGESTLWTYKGQNGILKELW